MKKKSGNSKLSETRAKLNAIKRKLAEMKEYKKLVAKDGLVPDAADKERESKLIVKLIRLERTLAELEGKTPTKRPAHTKRPKR